MSGPLNDGPRKMYSDGFRGNQMGDCFMDKPLERPGLMGKAPESSSLPNTLLTYLVCFLHKDHPYINKINCNFEIKSN